MPTTRRIIHVDLILANGYADLLLSLAADLVSIIRPGGTLILSGIPIQDKFDVQLAFQRQGCMLRDSRIGAECMTFIMETEGGAYSAPWGRRAAKG